MSTEQTEAPRTLVDRIKRMATIMIEDIEGFEAGNPVDRTEQDIELLDASLEENGLVMPPLVREKGKKTTNGEKGFRYELIDGHGRIDRIRQRFPGTKAIKVLVIECESVAEGRKIMLGLRNNARWDMGDLDAWMREALGEGLELEKAMKLTGFTAADLEALAEAGSDMLDELGDRELDAEEEKSEPKRQQPSMTVEVDIEDEPPKKPTTRIGDVWTLGDHRLVCGDALVKEIVQAALAGRHCDMLWTDPLDAQPTEKKPKSKAGMSSTDIAAALAGYSSAGTPVYVAIPTHMFSVFDIALTDASFHWSSTIIWAKPSISMSRKDFHPQHEPIWYGWRDGATRKCSPTDRAMSDLWTIDRPRKSEQHPSMKPVALVARSINSSSKPGDLVLDPFAGSGTTLLAAEQLGRRAALVEISPGYCDLIVARWEKLTGRKAKRTTV